MDYIDDLKSLVSDCIEVDEIYYQGDAPVVSGSLLVEPDHAFKILKERFKEKGLLPIFRRVNGAFELKVAQIPEIKEEKKWVNLLLFVITIFTTILGGSLLAGENPLQDFRALASGIPFSFTLLLILGSHELGHYFACKRRNIRATLPYFIPVPPNIFRLGTMGAVIRIKAPMSDKNSLIEVGAAGPFVGMIFAIPIVIWGLKLSEFTLLAGIPGRIALGNSLLFWTLSRLFTPTPPPGYDLLLHPIAFAGWLGMFVTALNLLPLGQLDGGHVAYALLGEKRKFITWPIIGIMLVLGMFWPGWLLWAALVIFVLGRKHPPPLNDVSPVDKGHKVIGVIALFVFIITFVPVPFWLMG